MNLVTIKRDKEGYIKGFTSDGHCGYADSGYDIVCAGISTLVINTINSIAEFTDVEFEPVFNEERAIINCDIDEYSNHDVQLLFKSLLLGLTAIYESYGNEYIKIIFEEV